MSSHTERYSEESARIIEKQPVWVIRWGNSVFFLITMVLGLFCVLVKYPDKITTSFQLTKTNKPYIVSPRQNATINKINIVDHQVVNAGKILIVLEGPEQYQSIVKLSKIVRFIDSLVVRHEWESAALLEIDDIDALGSMGADFEGLRMQQATLKTLVLGYIADEKQQILVKDIDNLTQLSENFNKQIRILEEDVQLAHDEYETQEKLFANKIISAQEYRREKSKLLTKKIQYENLVNAEIQNRSVLNDKRKELLALRERLSESKQEFVRLMQNIKHDLNQWDNDFLLKAPVSGRVALQGPLQEQQQVLAYEHLLSIEPVTGNAVGLIEIEQPSLGKLAEGQDVLVKLDGFPHREFGMIRGKLERFSEIPDKNGHYWGYVKLSNGLTTTRNALLVYRNGLKGRAEVITSSKSIAERILHALRPERR